jgi:hypothetical protein
MGGTVSTIPAVLETLVQRFALAVEPDGDASLAVWDGQPVNDADDVVAIGFTGVPGDEAITDTRDRAQMAPSPDREQYDITNVVSAWRGAEDDQVSFQAVRRRAFAMVDAMADDLASDPRLNGLVMSARLTSGNVAQYLSEGGVSVDVQVVISVDAFARHT